MSKNINGEERQKEKEKWAPHWAGTPIEGSMQGLIPGHWFHDLSGRQTRNGLNHPDTF